MKKVIINVWEILIILTGLLAFCGERFIGKNINPVLFIILFALYGARAAYKLTERIQDDIKKVKSGTWGEEE